MPKITIDISANDNATQIIEKVNGALAKGSKSQESMADAMFKGFTAANLLQAGISKVGEAVSFLTIGSLQTYSAFEQTNIAFTTMLGSADKATGLMMQMQEAATKMPYSFSEVANSGKQLIAFGVAADGVVDTLRRVGDVAAGLSQPIGDIVYLYGTVKTAGRAMSVDLMQFANRGIPIYEELAKITGNNTSEIKNLASQGKITFKEIDQVFKNLTSEGGKFANLMEKQSESLGGKWSNFGDSLEQMQVLIGQKLAPTANTTLTFMSNMLGVINGQMKDGGSSSSNWAKNAFIATTPLAAMFKQLTWSMEKINEYFASSDKLSASDQARVDAIKKYYAYLDGTVKLTKEEAAELKRIAGDYSATITIKKEFTDDEKEQIKQAESIKNFREREAALNAQYDKKKTEDADKNRTQASEEDKKAWARGVKDAEKYYSKLREVRSTGLADEQEKIELSKKEKLDELKEKEKYFKDYQDYIVAQNIIEIDAYEKLLKLKKEKETDFWKEASELQVSFFESSGNESVDAVGKMANEITDHLQTMAGTFSDIFKDISEDSKKTGMSLGDYFQAGCAVAVAGLSSIASVISMQYSLVKAGYDRQLEALNEKMEAELEAYNESLENQQSYSEETENLRLLELEAYAESLKEKTDKEIQFAIAKKKLELKKASEEKEVDKKKEAEKEAIKKKYAKAEFAIELEAFKSEQEYQKSMVKIQTAIGIVNAWASSMTLGPIAGPIAASLLTALLLGTAKKQLNLIDSEKPPTPSFAGGVTNFEGGLALVGERGREMVNLPKGSNVITNENTESLLSNFGGARYIINNIYLNGNLVQQDIVDTRRASAYGGY